MSIKDFFQKLLLIYWLWIRHILVFLNIICKSERPWNVFSLWAPSESCLLFMWSERSILCLVSFVSPSLSTVYDLSWARERACVGPAWTRRGHYGPQRLPCPAPLRPDNQGPLVSVTRACRPHRPGRHMPEENQLNAIISSQLLLITTYV